MKIQTILPFALTAGTLFAQAPALDLDARVQLFGEVARPVAITILNNAPPVQDEPTRQTGLGVRLMGELASLPNFYYELGGKMETSSRFTYNGPIVGSANGGTMDLTGIKVSSSYWFLGMAHLFHPVPALSLGAHLEGRGEALCARGQVLSSTGPAQSLYVSTTYLRPWVRLSADVIVPMGKLRPYVGVDVSGAVTRTGQTSYVSPNLMDGRTLKSLAPNYTAAFYLGVSF